jgi:uncharacterized repeat protein (TIGR01451 family)
MASRAAPLSIAIAVLMMTLGGAGGCAFGVEAQGPDLGVTILRDGDDPRGLITEGAMVTLSIGVDNLRGDTEAPSATLTVTVPDGLGVSASRPNAGGVQKNSTGLEQLTWRLGGLPAGAFPRMFEIDLRPAASAKPGEPMTVAAAVTSSDSESDTANNQAQFALRLVPAVADLDVRSDLDAVAFEPGGRATFKVEVSNWGSAVATQCVLAASLPSQVSFMRSDPPPSSVTGDIASWTLGDLKPAESRLIAITISGRPSKRAGSAPPKPVRFTMEASSASADRNAENNRLVIDRSIEAAEPDLKVWLGVEGTESPGELAVGHDATYSVTYGNFGTLAVEDSTVSLNLP